MRSELRGMVSAHRGSVALLALGLLVGLLLLVAFIYDQSRAQTISPGVSIAGVDVGGLSTAAARARVNAALQLRRRDLVTVDLRRAPFHAQRPRGIATAGRQRCRQRRTERQPRRMVREPNPERDLRRRTAPEHRGSDQLQPPGGASPRVSHQQRRRPPAAERQRLGQPRRAAGHGAGASGRPGPDRCVDRRDRSGVGKSHRAAPAAPARPPRAPHRHHRDGELLSIRSSSSSTETTSRSATTATSGLRTRIRSRSASRGSRLRRVCTTSSTSRSTPPGTCRTPRGPEAWRDR